MREFLHMLFGVFFFYVIPPIFLLKLLQVSSPLLDLYAWWQVLLAWAVFGLLYERTSDDRPMGQKLLDERKTGVHK